MRCPVCKCPLDAMSEEFQEKHYEMCKQVSELDMVKRQLDMANKIINDKVKDIVKLEKEKANLSQRLTQWTKEIDRLASVVHKQNNLLAKHGITDAACEK